MFTKILIANRGEIALRIIRACRKTGKTSILAYSKADRNTIPVEEADESICIGPPPAQQSYLSIPALLTAARLTMAREAGWVSWMQARSSIVCRSSTISAAAQAA